MRWTLLLALLPSLALAQSPTPRPEDLGTVTGHITCTDTQRPARSAEVDLVPIKPIDDSDPEAQGGQLRSHPNRSCRCLHPRARSAGRYYLNVNLTGYANPVSQFTTEELNAPTAEIQRRIQRELQLVTVTPNSTTRADATIHRGDFISGSVTYDDGSPAISLSIALFRRNASGKFLLADKSNTITNSHGQFAFDSLAPGEYIVQLMLYAMERRPGTWTFSDGKPRDTFIDVGSFSLPIYSGNVFREKDAAIIKVDAGQETDGVDITIPIDGLHEISGTLLGKDGHPVDNARVDLLFADTQEQFAGYWVDGHGTFRLSYVPDGSYILKVTHASDVEIVNVPGSPTHSERRTTHTYGDLQQPLTVQTSDQSLNLTLPDNPPQPSPKNSADPLDTPLYNRSRSTLPWP